LKVKEAVAFGIKDERLGHKIKVVISCKEENTITQEELREYCKTQLLYYMVSAGFIIENDLPNTNTGKVDRVSVRQKYAEHK
jgi:acyl-CoA synthetase (AMP-forming)/AMP-acid ligase II